MWPPSARRFYQTDTEDPDDFLVFDSQCGSVHPNADLSPQPHHRAQETILILNLQGAGLPYMGSAAAYGYQKQLKQWAEYASQFPEADWRPLVKQELQQELATTAHLHFCTAIRHTLMRVIA